VEVKWNFMRILVQISDLHFGTEIPAVVDALVEDIHTVKPNMIVVSGDVTQRSRADEFQRATEMLRNFSGIPVIAIPGNHDIPFANLFRRFVSPFAYFSRFMGTSLTSTFFDEEIAVVGINTANQLQWKNGTFKQEDVLELRRQFIGHDAIPWKIVAVHHPIELFARTTEDKILSEIVLRGGQRALEILQECGVSIIVAGHLHQSHIEELHASIHSLKSPMLMLQAGTAVSSRVRREGNSYNVLTLDGGTCHISIRVFNGKAFKEQRNYTFVRHT
jgi:3',5'-cyclic AMP phosphodiesterase CpdA